MLGKKTKKIITNLFAVIAAVLSWFSGFFVMKIVYDSVLASIIFGSILAVIVFCESRFTYFSLKSDGRIVITKEEIKSNFWQIIVASLVAILVAIPLEMTFYAEKIKIINPSSDHDLGLKLHVLYELMSTQWIPMVLICVLIIIIFQVPIFIRMASED